MTQQKEELSEQQSEWCKKKTKSEPRKEEEKEVKKGNVRIIKNMLGVEETGAKRKSSKRVGWMVLVFWSGPL